MEYDVKLTHKAGKQMIVADALSRRADYGHGQYEDNMDVTALLEDLWIKLLDTELQDAVATAQLGDTYAQEVLESLNDPSKSPAPWTREVDPNGTNFLFYNGRLYIPDDLRLQRRIVADHHDTDSAGHPGILATTRSVRVSYYWPGLQHFVKHYVNGCAACQQFKVNSRPTNPALHPIESGSSRLFGSIGIDFMTDLPLTEEGFDSIMVTVDHGLSKGVILTPTTKFGLNSETTARLFIDNVYARFGLPDKIITDRGVQFDVEFFRELCKQLGNKLSTTSTYHPQANGGTERVNREVQFYLSIYCINNPKSWAQALKKAEFVYNNRPHADRSQSPFELMYGLAPKAIPEAFDYSEYPSVHARLSQLAQWRKDAQIAHKFARERMKKRIRESYTPFAKGDKVWLEGRNLKLGYNKKIATKREGPFEIMEVLPPLNYRLRLPSGWKTHPTFHASLLTPYVENRTHGPNNPRPSPEVVEDHKEWEVDRILRHKGTKNISSSVNNQFPSSPPLSTNELTNPITATTTSTKVTATNTSTVRATAPPRTPSSPSKRTLRRLLVSQTPSSSSAAHPVPLLSLSTETYAFPLPPNTLALKVHMPSRMSRNPSRQGSDSTSPRQPSDTEGTEGSQKQSEDSTKRWTLSIADNAS